MYRGRMAKTLTALILGMALVFAGMAGRIEAETGGDSDVLPLVGESDVTDAASVVAENFNTHAGDNYKGINVGWRLENLDIEQVKSMVVELYAGEQLIATNTAIMEAIIEDLPGEDHFSTPFIVHSRTYVEKYWEFGDYTLDEAAHPDKAVITVTDADGNILVAEKSGLSNLKAVPYESLFQDYPPVYNRTTKTYHDTVQDAIDAIFGAAATSNVTYIIEIAEGTYSDPVEIRQQEHKSIVLQPIEGKEVTFTGNAVIKVDGMGRFDGQESVTVKGITFDFSETEEPLVTCITGWKSGTSGSQYVYAHNIIVDGCTFLGTGNDEHQVVGLSLPSGGGHAAMTLNDCTAVNTYLLFSGYSTSVTVEGCSVRTELGGAVNAQSAGANVAVKNCYFDVTKHGIRSGAGTAAPTSSRSLKVENTFIRVSSGAGTPKEDEAVVVLRGGAPAKVTISSSVLISESHPVILHNYAGLAHASAFNFDLSGNYWESADVVGVAAHMFGNLPLQLIDTCDDYYTGYDAALEDVVEGNLILTGRQDFEPEPWYVDDSVDISGDGTTPEKAFKTIGEALLAAAPGDAIRVAPGTYNEVLTINKRVSLRGAQYGVDARDRTGAEESVLAGQSVLSINADGVTIDGFTIGPAEWPNRISPEADDITIKNNIIERTIYVATTVSDLTLTQNWFKNTAGDGASAFTSESSITNLEIKENKFTHIPYSAVILGGSVGYHNSLIADNHIHGCGYQALNFAGKQANLLVTGNYIEDAYSEVDSVNEPDRGGIRIYGSDFTGPVNITNNTVVNSYNGFAVKDDQNIEGKAINVTGNRFLNNRNKGVYNGGTGTLNATRNYWGSAGDPGEKVHGKVEYDPWYDSEDMAVLSTGRKVLNISSGRSYDTIQGAINEAANGHVIHVRPGTYEEDLVIDGTNITLLSTGGSEETTIQPTGTQLGAIVLKGNTTGVTIGSEGHGFTILGVERGDPGIETAAIYLQGPHSNIHVEGNEIVAGGDLAIATEWSAAVSDFTITKNVISGKTFVGDAPAGQGADEQFTLPNVPRPLVYIGGTNKSDVTFTLNEVTGVTGGLNPEGKPQGNTVVSIDADGAVITGNSFSGDTAWTAASLRARGKDTVVKDNEFHSGPFLNLHVYLGDGTVEGGADAVAADNSFDRAAYVVEGTLIHTSIQNAVDAANAGDTVKVSAGTYEENVVIPVGKNDLTLVGAGSDAAIIAPKTGSAVSLKGLPGPSRPIDGITVQGFTLKAEDGCAFIALSSTLDDKPYTTDLALVDIVVPAGSKYGIVLNAVDGVTLTDVRVFGLEGSMGALELTGVENLVLTDCVFADNEVAVRLQPTGSGDVGQGYGPNGDIKVSGSLFRNNGVAIENQDDGVEIDATLNHWSHVAGPSRPDEVAGDVITENVDFVPWYLDEDMDIQSDKLKLTVSVSGEGGVKKEPPGPEYSYGDVVKLTPAPGWRFSSWSSNVAASEGYLEVTMDWNKTVALTLSRVGETSGGGGGPSGPTGPVLPPVIAPSVTAPIDTTTGGTVELEDGSAAVEMPPNATEEEVTVTLAPVTEVTQPTTGMVMIAGKVFEITAETSDGDLVTQFSQPLTLTFRVTEEELEETEAELEDLRVFYWDDKAGAWIALPTTVDPETGTVTALTDHFMVFALMAKPDMPALNDIPGHWAEKYILRLVSLGVVGGYEDGSYRPEAGITRQEFAKMVVLAAGLEADAEPELTFADAGEIAGWARGYVSAAVNAGIITGVGDNRFAPADSVTRAQAATMIIRALGIEASGTPEAFADGDAIPEWALSSIQAAVEKAIIDGFEDNTFRPDLNATRAQAAKMLSRLTEVRFED